MSALPGLVLGRAQDGAGRDTKADGTGALVPGRGANTFHEGCAVGQGFTPEHEDIDAWCQHSDGGGGAAAAKERDTRALEAGNAGMGGFDAIERTVKVEGFALGPGEVQEVDVFAHAVVATVMIDVVAVHGLFCGAGAGNEMHGRAPAGEMIKRSKFAGCDRGRNKARAVSDEKAQVLCDAGGLGGNHEAIGRVREITHECGVEPGFLVDACGCVDGLDIESNIAPADQFGLNLVCDPSD